MKKNQQKIIKETLDVIRKQGHNISPNEFLQKIAQYVSNLFEVEYVLINKYSIKTPKITETVVAQSKNKTHANFSYELANTPCENVINKDICAHTKNIQALFPKDELLVQMNIESYVGMPLWSSTGEPIGLIALLDSKPLKELETIKLILQIVAIKVEKVLERLLFNSLLNEKMKNLEVLNNKNKDIEEKFSKAFFNNPIAMEIIDINTGDRIEANESYLQIFEYSRDEFLKGNAFTNKLIIKPEVRDKNKKELANEGYFKETDFKIVSKSGTIKNLIVSGTKLNIDDGNKALLIFEDVSEQHNNNISLKKSEEKLKNLANLTFEGILIHKNGIVEDVNHALEKMFEYSKDELIGENIVSKFFPEKYHNKIQEKRASKEVLPYEIEGIRKSGAIFPLEIETRNIDNKNNTEIRVVAFRDLTDRYKTQEQTTKLTAAVEQSANTIVITDVDGNIEYVNPKFTETSGYTLSEAIGQNPRILNAGKQPKEYYENLWKTISEGNIWNGEFQNKAKNGELFWEHVTITPIKNDLGKIINYLAVKEDITKRKKDENNLKVAFQLIKENEDYLSNILKNTNEGFWAINLESKTVEINPEMCKILGYSEIEIMEKSIFDFVDEENTKIFKQQLKNRALGVSSAYEISLKKSNGKSVPCLFKTSPIYNNENNRIGSFAMVTDISELKIAQENSENQNRELQDLSSELSLKNMLLLESNNRFKNLFELSPVSIWEQDYSGALKLLTKKKAQVKDLKVYLDKNPDFVLECVYNIKSINVNKTTLNLIGVKNKEELIIQLNKTLNKEALEVLKKEFLVIASSEKRELTEIAKFIKTDGTEITTILRLIKLNDQGKAIVTLNDITALKVVEQQLLKARDEAEESDRLKTEFLNNMSHEIRTPMNGILGFSKMLSEPDIEDGKRNNFINIIQNSGYQLLHIIDDILEISRLGTKQVKVLEEEVCLNDLLLELFSIFDIKAKENKTPLYLKKVLSDKESTIISDKTKLNKIFSNLLENALKFTNNGFIEIGYTLKNNNTELEIYVKDTGIGIKPEKQQLIFERFEQAEKELTRKVGGLGLGLSIAKENTELLGGTISVKSEMMEGAIFFVNIPFKPVFQIIEIDANIKKYTILVAEDEEINFMYIETILKSVMNLNCEILHAKDGQEAVSICKSNSNIDLVLMDLKMPYLNGINATKQIRKFNSSIPIVAQTAYSTIEEREEAMSVGCNDFISKPIEKEVLIDVVDKILSVNI